MGNYFGGVPRSAVDTDNGLIYLPDYHSLAFVLGIDMSSIITVKI